jgi:hypothetical protein
VAEQLQILNEATGVGTTQLQVFQKSLEMAGGSAEQAQSVLRKLNQAIDEGNPLLERIGATGLGTWESLMKVADAMAVTEKGSKRQAAAIELLGKNSEAAIAVLSKGSDSMARFESQLVAVRAVMTEEFVGKFGKLDEQLDQLNLTMEAIRLTIAQSALPSLLLFFNILEHIRIRVAILVPMLKLLGATLDFFNAKFEFNRSGADAALRRMADAAREVGTAAVNAKKDLEALKALAASLSKPPPGPTFDKPKPGPFSLPQRADFGMADADVSLRVGGRGRFEIGPMLDEAKEHLTSYSELVRKIAGDTYDALAHIADAMRDGIVQTFVNMAQAGQTFRSAWAGIWLGVKQVFLQSIGEIIASQVVQAFFKLLGIVIGYLTNNPALGTAIAGIGGGVGGGRSLAPSPVDTVSVTGSRGGFGGATGGVQNFYIQALSAMDVLQSLVSPLGEMRAANSRLLEVASAS